MTNQTNFLDPIVAVQKVEIFFPLYQFDLSNETDIDKTISKIKILRNNNPTTTTTNVITKTGWRSPYMSANQPEIQIFKDEIILIQKKLNQINSFKTELVNLWAVIYDKHDFSKTHNHFNLWDKSAYNTILYLNDSNTPLVFETTESKIEIFPRRGLLVVMHPLMNHSVPVINDDSERIVLVCNFSM